MIRPVDQQEAKGKIWDQREKGKGGVRMGREDQSAKLENVSSSPVPGRYSSDKSQLTTSSGS